MYLDDTKVWLEYLSDQVAFEGDNLTARQSEKEPHFTSACLVYTKNSQVGFVGLSQGITF